MAAESGVFVDTMARPTSAPSAVRLHQKGARPCLLLSGFSSTFPRRFSARPRGSRCFSRHWPVPSSPGESPRTKSCDSITTLPGTCSARSARSMPSCLPSPSFSSGRIHRRRPKAQREASLLGSIYRDAVALRQPASDQFLAVAAQYGRQIVIDEWPAMARGGEGARAQKAQENIWR